MTASTDHDLVGRWIATWMHARGLEASMIDGWPLVQVGSPTRETELICVDPGLDTFATLLPHIDGDPRAMLTVIADDIAPYAELPLPPGVRIDRDDETLMSTIFEPLTAPPLDPALVARWEVGDRLATYSVESGERVASAGTIGILDTYATFDAVETSPGFQRRGLGRHVMSVLTAYALESGARTGVLAATAQGRPLYESLGWHQAYAMRSLMGVPRD